MGLPGDDSYEAARKIQIKQHVLTNRLNRSFTTASNFDDRHATPIWTNSFRAKYWPLIIHGDAWRFFAALMVSPGLVYQLVYIVNSFTQTNMEKRGGF